MSHSVPLVIPALESLAISALPQGTQWWLGEVLPPFQAGPGQVENESTGIIVQIKTIHFEEDAYAELGPNFKHEEHYSIEGCVVSWSGGTWGTFDQCLQDAYTAYSMLTKAIGNNPTLGLTGIIPRIAWPRQRSVLLGPDFKGFAQAQIEFEIYVEARVPSLT